MGMCANHTGNTPVQVVCHARFFGRGLGMKIQENRLHVAAQPVFSQQRIHGLKRVIHQLHEQTSHGVDDQDTPPGTVFINAMPLPRCF